MAMSLRSTVVAVSFLGMLGFSPAFAADNAMQVCGAKYQAAKTAKTLPAGQTWGQFLAQCRSTLPKATASAAPAAAPPVAPKAVAAKHAAAPAAPHPAGQPTAGQLAARARQRDCGQQWKAAKAANKIPAGQTWPQYWSQCNARMKG